jgi:5S rRNA maturation endonuclease (ribonuclease M5)
MISQQQKAGGAQLSPIPDLIKRIDLRKLHPESARQGKVSFVSCPHHADGGRPNMAVYADHAFCYSCRYVESAFEHIKRVRHLSSMRDALRVAQTIIARDVAQGDEDDRAKGVASLNPTVVERYYAALSASMKHREFIAERYGIGSKLQRDARLGHTGLAFSIPVFGLDGALRNIRFRIDDRSKPKTGNWAKYWGVKGCNQNLWSYPPTLRGRTLREAVLNAYGGSQVVLCEGELDALALTQVGVCALSATNGARSLLYEGGAPLLEELRGLEVLVAYDQDAVGRDSARELTERLRSLGIRASSVEWDPLMGKDPSELVSGGYGKDDFVKLISKNVDFTKRRVV